jgi:hypothetical protein
MPKKEESMSTQAAKNDALCKEFPFLRRYLHYANMERNSLKVLISRVNYALLKEKTDVGQKEYIWKRIFFLDCEGNELHQVGVRMNHSKKFCWWNPSTWNKFSTIYHEAVEEALVRIGSEETEKIKFILWTQDNKGITIFKYPKNFTLREWVDKEFSDASKEIQDELLEIDKV